MSLFLGRSLNSQTMCFEFADGSGVPIPFEHRQVIEEMIEERKQGAGWMALAAIESLKERLAAVQRLPTRHPT